MILVLGIAACDSGSSSSSYDAAASAIPTIDQLVGTWESIGTYPAQTSYTDGTVITYTTDYTEVTTFTKTDTTTGTYDTLYTSTHIFDDEETTDQYYYIAEQGVFKLDEDGTVTTNPVLRAYSFDEPVSMDDTESIEDEEWEYRYQLVILDSVLYYSPFKRVDTGSGLTGNWKSNYYSNSYGSEHYYRTLVEITATRIVSTWESSENGITFSETGSTDYSYTKNGNKLVVQTDDGSLEYAYKQSGNWLILSNRNATSQTSFGYVKK